MNRYRSVAVSAKPKYRTFFGIIALFVLLSSLLSFGCADKKSEEVKPADYGEYGKTTAVAIASRYPDRYAYTEQERKTGEFIQKELQNMGYSVETQRVYDPMQSGVSANYIVRIPGEGFMHRGEDDNYTLMQKTVIVGAHYDVTRLALPEDTVSTEDASGDETSAEPTEQTWLHDGIQDNASGVACLLTLASEIRNEKPAYDVILVFFGAGSADYQGARTFLKSLTKEQKTAVDVMYCVESIYAGDKLYASSGLTSILPGKKYEFRRKLYEAYDVVYNNMLKSKNNVDLYYNMSGLLMDLNPRQHSGHIPGSHIEQVRLRAALMKPIPTVFIESFEYNATALQEMMKQKPGIQEEGGFVRRTTLDSYAFLKKRSSPRIDVRHQQQRPSFFGSDKKRSEQRRLRFFVQCRRPASTACGGDRNDSVPIEEKMIRTRFLIQKTGSGRDNL